MTGEINDWRWWVHPRAAVVDVMAALSCSKEAAVAFIVRRLIGQKVVSIRDEYRGPKDESNLLYPEHRSMPLWCGVWLNEVFRSPSSSVWTTGDIEASVDNEPCYFFNIRLHRSDFEASLRDCGAIGLADRGTEELPARAIAPASPIGPAKQLQPKWRWDEALAVLVAIADKPNGLHSIEKFEPGQRGAQAKLERWLATYFSNANAGDGPPTSECRHRAKLIMDALQR